MLELILGLLQCKICMSNQESFFAPFPPRSLTARRRSDLDAIIWGRREVPRDQTWDWSNDQSMKMSFRQMNLITRERQLLHKTSRASLTVIFFSWGTNQKRGWDWSTWELKAYKKFQANTQQLYFSKKKGVTLCCWGWSPAKKASTLSNMN